MEHRRDSSKDERDRESRSEEESVLHAAALMDSSEPCLTEGGEKERTTGPVETETHSQ